MNASTFHFFALKNEQVRFAFLAGFEKELAATLFPSWANYSEVRFEKNVLPLSLHFSPEESRMTPKQKSS